jgi:hypothetical protein
MSIQRSTLIASIASLLGLTLAASAQAASIDFSTWTAAGDVVTPALGEAAFSTNALDDDDFAENPPGDDNYNLSGTPAVGNPFVLANNLGLNSEDELNPDPDNFVFATDGSGLTQQLTFLETTDFTFNWRFFTNDEIFTVGGMDFGDYAFLAINGSVTNTFGPFANPGPASSPQPTCSSGSQCQYVSEVSGDFSRRFAPGTYAIALGVVDVDDVTNSSAFSLINAQLNEVTATSIPEPASPMSLVALGTLGTGLLLKRKQK